MTSPSNSDNQLHAASSMPPKPFPTQSERFHVLPAGRASQASLHPRKKRTGTFDMSHVLGYSSKSRAARSTKPPKTKGGLVASQASTAPGADSAHAGMAYRHAHLAHNQSSNALVAHVHDGVEVVHIYSGVCVCERRGGLSRSELCQLCEHGARHPCCSQHASGWVECNHYVDVPIEPAAAKGAVTGPTLLQMLLICGHSRIHLCCLWCRRPDAVQAALG